MLRNRFVGCKRYRHASIYAGSRSEPLRFSIVIILKRIMFQREKVNVREHNLARNEKAKFGLCRMIAPFCLTFEK